MSKKGFTLVELMGVIIILGIILTIAIPTVDITIKNTKASSYNDQVSIIRSAANDWALKNSSSLPTVKGNSTLIYLGTLKQAGLVEINLKNPMNGKNLSNLSQITLTKVENGFDITINLIDLDGNQDSDA